uniref:Ycf55 n=1 Tax=Acrochaetium secundatum TaxID=209631 RepID=A0A4D6BM77_9FLOR|nr:hypothetical protein [Acrochaetium secundatum]QBX88338.1 hypothetical protein [Acrochaetium secundatum]
MNIQYWPKKQGIELNMQVSKLFRKLYLKFNYNLYNNTNNVLSIDIVNVHIKKEIFRIILLELEILILDIIELDLHLHDLEQLNKKILIDLVNKSINNFWIRKIHTTYSTSQHILLFSQIKNKLLSEDTLLLQDLLVYLVFGDDIKQTTNYLFISGRTPTKHIEILLDNLIIQLADIIFSEIIKTEKSIYSLFSFLMSMQICKDRYLSTRSLATFRNNLIWSYYIDFYIRLPKMVYNNRYKVWLFSKDGLKCQYIYANRKNHLRYLSNIQIVIITLLEIQDFILPKLKSLISLVGKISLTIFHNLIAYTISNILQSIITITRYQKKL